MTLQEIRSLRLHHQQISCHGFGDAAELVRWMGAMQAQDYRGALWSIGLRLPAARESEVAQAIASRKIVRTWPMRGTLHFVAAADARWMLRLLAPRVIRASRGRLRQLELDEPVLSRSKKIIISALRDGRSLSRPRLYEILEQKGVSTQGQRGIHILQQLSLEGTLCLATHQGKQPAFALLEQWLAPAAGPDGEEALAELALRYFTSHGPATADDFGWWSGLRKKEVKTALHLATPGLARISSKQGDYWMGLGQEAPPDSAKAFLLPGFDEYLLGYTDRSAVLGDGHAERVAPGGNGLFLSTIVVKGRVAGLWRQRSKKDGVEVVLHPFGELNGREQQAVDKASRRFIAFRKI
jgi:hypothetical protein